MLFEVELSEHAEEQYDAILFYLAYKLKNPQAVSGVMEDFDTAIKLLERNADVYGMCNSRKLRDLGFHKLHFEKHKYLMVYRIKEHRVIVEGIYHELQDYENSIE